VPDRQREARIEPQGLAPHLPSGEPGCLRFQPKFQAERAKGVSGGGDRAEHILVIGGDQRHGLRVEQAGAVFEIAAEAVRPLQKLDRQVELAALVVEFEELQARPPPDAGQGASGAGN